MDDLLDAARAGCGGALVIRGEPGVGKSSLLAYAASRADGMTMISTRGVESEVTLGFSGLLELLRPVLDVVDRIPENQAAALRGALALGPPAGDRLAVAAATLGLITVVCEKRPLLILVDDVHWLDESSGEVLLFAVRRIASECVAFLCAHRDGHSSAFAAADLAESPLGGLDRSAADELLTRVCGRMVAADVAGRVFVATKGNPLALMETPILLSERQLSGRDPIDEPLPIGPRLATAFLGRAEGLPDGTRRALVVLAASDDEHLDVIEPALSRLGVRVEDLDAAEEATLITVTGDHVVWCHPLIRAAIYQTATGGQRRRAHQALAQTQDLGRRAWHLAVASPDTDEEVASALEQAAADAGRRGAGIEAARALERAARASPTPPGRARRLLAAAREHAVCGHPNRAVGLVDEVLDTSGDVPLRADAQLLRARVEVWKGEPVLARERLLTEASIIEDVDPGRAAMMLVEAAAAATLTADLHANLEIARQAANVAQRAGEAEQAAAASFMAEALLLRGEAHEAATWRDGVRAFLAAGDPLGAAAITWPLGDMWLERYLEAERWVDRVVATARGAGALGLLPFPLVLKAQMHWWTGRWRSATTMAGECVRLAEETMQPNIAAWGLAILAQLDAGQGREEDCRDHAGRAVELADRCAVATVPIYAASVLGFLELGLGRPEPALSHLERVARLVAECGLRHPAVVPFGPDLVEASLFARRRSEAERALAVLEEHARATGLAWPRATAARCDGLLAGDDDLDRTFLRALQLHDATPTPFERARTELCYGRRLRRAKRLTDARRPLHRALKTFEQLGAEPWANRTRTELAAAGGRASPVHMPTLSILTGKELEIATLVAEGKKNGDIAAELFLSPKTVEFHLTRVYSKLGLRSRTELARTLIRS